MSNFIVPDLLRTLSKATERSWAQRSRPARQGPEVSGGNAEMPGDNKLR